MQVVTQPHHPITDTFRGTAAEGHTDFNGAQGADMTALAVH